MKKRAILTTVVSFVLLAAVVIAGLNAIFTVSGVRSSLSAYSAEGEREAYELQEELDGFVGKSLTFLDLNEIEETVKKYPCFRVEEIKKRYPDEVELSVRERREVFAYQTHEGKYAVLDEEVTYIYEKDTIKNRVSGDNVKLLGFRFNLGEQITGDYYPELVEVYRELQAVLGEVRANLVSVDLVYPTDATQTRLHYFRLTMREGVRLILEDPLNNAGEKARLAAELYAGVGDHDESLFLGDAEKVGGELRIYIINGKVTSDYRTTD